MVLKFQRNEGTKLVTLMYTISWSADPGFSRYYSYLPCQQALRPALKSSTCRAIYGPSHRINYIQDCARNKIFFCDVLKNLVRGGMSFDETLHHQKKSFYGRYPGYCRCGEAGRILHGMCLILERVSTRVDKLDMNNTCWILDLHFCFRWILDLHFTKLCTF